MKTINDYAELVKEKHALNKTIAPVETDLTDASKGYHIGEHFIYDGELYKAKTEIAQHDALVLNTNYEPADDLTTQIKNAGGGTGTDPRLDVFENNIAPVETDETDASKAYQVGDQLILNNILYDVIAAISEHDVITTTGSGANIAPAGSISSKIQTLTNNIDVLVDGSAVNKLPNNAVIQTVNGVTFTVNSDKTITVSTESSGATSLTQFILFEGVANWHNMILSGAPSTASATTYDLAAYDTQTSGENSCRPNDVVLTNITDGHTIRVFIRVRSGQVITEPITFKPMIADADYTGGYVPYAKTNQELTAENQTLMNEVKGNWATGGVNLFNPSIYVAYKQSDGSYRGTAAEISSITVSISQSLVGKELTFWIYLDLTKETSPTSVSTFANVNGTKINGNGIFSDKEGISAVTFTPQSTSDVIGITYGSDGSNYFSFKDIQLEVGSSATAYVPYAMTNRELTEILSDVGTYNVPVIMGSAQSSYVRGAIPYHDKTSKHTVTINSVKQFADSTDYTSQFSVDYSNSGFAIIYSGTVALAGALMNVNVTVS